MTNPSEIPPEILAKAKEILAGEQKGLQSVGEDLIKAFLEGRTNMPKQHKPGVISYEEAHPQGTPKASEDEPWDGKAEVAAADIDDLKIMCAWVDPEHPDLKKSYKLPHHRASGQHPVVWQGIRAAMSAFFSVRTPIDIPDEDLRGVYDHLAKHYAEFGEVPLGFRIYFNVDEVKRDWEAGTLSAKEALILVEKVTAAKYGSALEEAKQEAEYWKHELAKLAARILLTCVR
jgi:hypothetical protein